MIATVVSIISLLLIFLIIAVLNRAIIKKQQIIGPTRFQLLILIILYPGIHRYMDHPPFYINQRKAVPQFSVWR
jgi:hypothetical protein